MVSSHLARYLIPSYGEISLLFLSLALRGLCLYSSGFNRRMNEGSSYSATILTYCFNTGGIVKTVSASQLNFSIIPRLSKD